VRCGIGSWAASVRPASDNGRLCQGAGGHARGGRCRRVLMLAILGLPPKHYPELLGRRVKKGVKKATPATFDLIE